MKKKALISVSNKSGVVEFARALSELEYELYSTGGTAKILREAELEVIEIASFTGFPELLSGRLKTLHPKVFAGLLARPDNEQDVEEMNREGLDYFDLLVVNLYPFEENLKKGVSFAEQIEQIDIGGPSLLRAAAKNHKYITVIEDPGDYKRVLEELQTGGTSPELRLALAAKVFRRTAVYDSLIADYLDAKSDSDKIKSPYLSLAYVREAKLRYGENPQQEAVAYRDLLPVSNSIMFAKQLQGKELSFNNYGDAAAAAAAIQNFKEPTVVALKHANPCGVASAETIEEAYELAHAGDPISIFGGIVAQNREVSGKEARQMLNTFLEVIIAPEFSEEARLIFAEKKNLRLLKLKDLEQPYPGQEKRFIPGGLLIQDYDDAAIEDELLTVVTKIKPEAAELEDYRFAMKVCRLLKSNAIAITKGRQSIGIGPGQTNRVGAAKIALEMAGERAKGAILASDAFFPFKDTCELAAQYGIKGIIQPGGSLRDEDSIAFCNANGIAMIFTGKRHFKH